MATTFRATVMLAVLVGLPAAWVYYGPLPPAAMGVIERTIASAKQSCGWSSPTPAASWNSEVPKTAPRFDASIARATRALRQQTSNSGPEPPTRAVTRDPQFSLASATVPVDAPAPSAPVAVEGDLARQLEPHLSLLRSLDAAEYTLENWGGGGQLYRFRCAITLSENDDHTRQFEAIDADPLRAVHQVVGEVTSWQNARRLDAPTRWQ